MRKSQVQRPSRMLRKCLALKCVGTLRGPHTSQCNRSKKDLVEMELKGKERCVCLTMGQKVQLFR